MKRTFKRTISLVLAVLMVMTVVPFSGLAATCEVCNYKYESAMTGWHSYQCTVCASAGYAQCSGGEASCVSGAICEFCGTEYTAKLDNHGKGTIIVGDKYFASAANCKNRAQYYYACEICEEPIKDGDTYSVGEIDVNTHVYETAESNENGTHKATCALCGTKSEDAACEDAEPNVIAPSCTEDGKTENTCDACGYTWDSDATTATGHSYTEESGIKAEDATCTTKAKYWLSCADCGANAKDDENAQDKTYELGDVLPHVYDKEEAEAEYIVSPATCQQKATYYKSCVCGAKGTETFEGAMGTCSWGEYVYDEGSAQCEVDGTKTATCIYGCGKTDTITAENTALGHEFTREIEAEDRIATPGTCLKKPEYYHTCSRCDAVSDSSKFIGKDFGPHDFTKEDAQPQFVKENATCKSLAKFYYSCSLCGTSSKGFEGEGTFEFGSTLPHDFQAVAKDEYILIHATCLDPSVYTKSCAECGERKVPEDVDITGEDTVVSDDDIFYGPALGHNLKKTAEAVAPSCIMIGYTEEYTCQNEFAGVKCGFVQKEELPMLEHQWKQTQEYKAPTCKQNGQYGLKKCDGCATTLAINEKGETLSVSNLASFNISALGHVDADEDMICDRDECLAILEPEDTCTCICHRNTGIMYFVVLILKWFWQLIDTNQICECGNYHY